MSRRQSASRPGPCPCGRSHGQRAIRRFLAFRQWLRQSRTRRRPEVDRQCARSASPAWIPDRGFSRLWHQEQQLRRRPREEAGPPSETTRTGRSHHPGQEGHSGIELDGLAGCASTPTPEVLDARWSRAEMARQAPRGRRPPRQEERHHAGRDTASRPRQESSPHAC
jgi:hypothetical protein